MKKNKPTTWRVKNQQAEFQTKDAATKFKDQLLKGKFTVPQSIRIFEQPDTKHYFLTWEENY